ncbi:MAG: N-6 DNA methylase [Bryobacteraceae bacterium]|jgi:hypothetical protein
MTPFVTRVLATAGYVTEAGEPLDGLVLSATPTRNAGDGSRVVPLLSNRPGGLAAEAVFRIGTSPVVVFKSLPAGTEDETKCHKLAWNFGVAPLLWITTPEYVRLYNAYQPPEEYEQRSPLLREFQLGQGLEQALAEINATCSRRHIAMGSFWQSALASPIDRRKRVDNVLLGELMNLLGTLVRQDLRASLAQKLVGRCIFFQYLVHRGYVREQELAQHFGAPSLDRILTDMDATYSLFRWIRRTFNGDLFPIEDEATERAQLRHDARLLGPLSDFFGHFNVSDRQGRLFPFRFDAIPVELISSIYEKFVHMSEPDGEPPRGVHYTPINVVDLVLDPVFENLSAMARVLDAACGSGVFLVESLRRLVWLRSPTQPPTRELIRDVLMRQIRGVDISPAALSVAAFSLYLALLELDPDPPRGLDALDCLRFEPIQGRVLFSTSTFNPSLAARIADDQGRHGFDAIVGNPPWTYSAKEKEEDRALAHQERTSGLNRPDDDSDVGDREEEGSLGEAGLLVCDDPERRLGTTYARLNALPIPPRSMDWPFLWRCREFSHHATRIALVMKATPFFSQAPNTSSARDALLRAFPNVNLVNLSQLRTSQLFQESEDQEGSELRNKSVAGPALLFFSNCLSVAAVAIGAVSFPWTPGFQRTGVFELPAEPPKFVLLEAALREPALLKIAMFGTERDVWFLERLARSPHAVRLKDWCQELDLPVGQGYRAGTRMPSAHLKGLPRVTARDFRSPALPIELPLIDDETVDRAREAAIYRGPLVLLPEGKLTAAPVLGRYTGIFDSRDLGYNESFVGVSFSGRDVALARAFAAVMNSALVTYQIAFQGGTVGIKQTKVEAIDLENVRIPQLDRLPTETTAMLASAADTLRSVTEPMAVREALATIDAIVAAALHLTDAELELLADTERRAGAIFFETPAYRLPMENPPAVPELTAYARNLCSTFNTFATEDDDLVLVPDRYATLADDVVVLKLSLRRRARAHARELRPGTVSELGDAFLSELGGTELPYLKPPKSLRIYAGRAVYLLKSAHYRCFSPSAGQADGDRIIADLMHSEFPRFRRPVHS